MKEILIFLSIVPGVIYAPFKPWIGVLYWTWVSIMNPHRLLTYGWVLSMPWALALALGTVGGMMFTKQHKHLPMTREVWILIIFVLWMIVTTVFAINVDDSSDQLKKVMKIDFMVLVAIALLNTRKHIILLTGTLVISLGYYGFKGGLFTIQTGGSERVWGPAGTYIEGNNELALALIMIIPFMHFMYSISHSKWVKRGLMVLIFLTAFSALGSQSRGALLAISAMALVMWFRSKQKAKFGVVLVITAVVLVNFMPDSWSSRMNTVKTYDKDASAMGRINAWYLCYNIAKDRVIGGGYEIYDSRTFQKYAPDPLDTHVAHSIYFSVLGEHGFPGLFIFLTMWYFVWNSAAWIRKNARAGPEEETKWAFDLASACQVSIAGYAVGGAFLSLAYFDLPYNILILVVLTRKWLEDKAWTKEEPETDRLAVMVGYAPTPAKT